MSHRVKLYICEDCGEPLNSEELIQVDLCPECGGDCSYTGESVWIDDMDTEEGEES